MKKIILIIRNLIKGFLIGASVLIPGLSGGTMSIILGIYSQILEAVDSLFLKFKDNTLFLSTLAVGGLIGFYSCTFPIKYLILNFELEFSYLIIGIILGSVPMFFNSRKVFTVKNGICFLIGFLSIFAFEILGEYNLGDNPQGITLILISMLSAVALILPGISLTNILIAFGYYEKIITAISNFEIVFLLKFALLMLVSIILFTKILNRAYKKYPVSINTLILGMMLASVKQVFIRVPQINETLTVTFITLAGFFIALLFTRFEKTTDSI